MKKGIKLGCHDRSNQKAIAVCAECLYIVEWRDKYCWQCGCLFSPDPIGANERGGFDWIAERRKEYQEDSATGWEDND